MSARNLQPDTYIDNIEFYNTTNNQGNATRAAMLVVNPKDYKVTVRASPPAEGAVSGAAEVAVSGAAEVAEGSSTAVMATANTGFHFVQWTEAGHVVSTSSTYTFTMPSKAVTLVADFQKN